MSNSSPLIVPMVVEALVVNDDVRAPKGQIQTFMRTEMAYGALQSAANAQPFTGNNDLNFTGNGKVPPNQVDASDYYNGVYLKWRLPKAYTHGAQDSVNGATTFRQVPNRWLVVRYSGQPGSRQASAWIVESDYQYPVNAPPSPMNVSQGASMYVQPTSATNLTPVGCRIGRNVALGSWTESGSTLNLTALAPGNPAFAFYQPQCNNVFSFVDCLNGQPAETLSYFVVGWFSDAANDSLAAGLATSQVNRYGGLQTTIVFSDASATQVDWSAGTLQVGIGTPNNIAAGNTGAMYQTTYIYLDPATSTTQLQITTDSSVARAAGCVLVAAAEPFFVAQLQALGWTLPTGTDPTLTASWSLLCGSVDGVAWQSTALPFGGTPSGATPVSVAVGNTSVEALTAMITAQAGGADVEPQLLEAFQLNALDVLDEPDGAAVLAEKLQASFFQRFSGGYQWTIVDAPDSDTKVSDAELQKEEQWLATLNQNQQNLDQAITALASLQSQLYAMWWKYTSWPFQYNGSSAIPCLDDQSNLQNQIDPTVSGSLAQQVAQQMGQVSTLAELVPTGDTPDALNDAIAAYAASQQLPTERVLKRRAAQTFYEINNPVVLIAGAGASGIVPAPDTIECRFSSQLVTGFKYGGQNVTAATLTIPQPTLSGVSGAPWSATLMTSLIQEFFFLDPNNATMVQQAIGGDVTLIAAAMTDPANDIGTAPVGAVRQWTQNPWHPLLLFWSANYYPIEYGAPAAPHWSFYNGQYVWDCSQASIGQTPLGLQGLIQLSPTAAFNMESRLQQFLNNNPNLNPEEAQAFKELLQFVQTHDAWDLLSQSLDGFNAQLLSRLPGVFMHPSASQFVTSPPLSTLIGSATTNPPAMPPIPMQGQGIPASLFQPWRAGQWEFLNLVVTDEWGQALWPFASLSGSYKNETVFLPPALQPVLKSNLVNFTISAVPAIASLSPALASAGAAALTLTVNGVGFTSSATVQWNGANLATSFVNANQLTATVPANLLAAQGSAQVTVETGSISAPVPFTTASGPAIGNITPNLAQAGMIPSDTLTVTVTGVAFAPGALVQWNGTALDTEVVSATLLTAEVPANFAFAPGIATITVLSGGATSNGVPFTVSAGAAIGSVSPSLALAGGASFTLKVNGVGFEPASVLTFNGAALPTAFVDAAQLTATVSASLIAGAGTVPVVEQVGSKVLPTAPDPFIQAPPALLQPARLDFPLISATDDSKVFGPLNPGADPICGWVIPNHLDGSLMAYDSAGDALGEMSLGITVSGTQTVCWTPAPNSAYQTLAQIAAAIPHFGPFLLSLSQQTTTAFGDFLQAIDETLWTTQPVGAVVDRGLAVLIGRPLAMIRARLQFLLSGPPNADPAWQYTFNPSNCSQIQAQTPAITSFQFAVELGNLAQLNDGLIGYFTADNYNTLNVVAQSGGAADGYLNPIGSNNNYIYLPFDGATTEYVSMLVDPRAPVHATTAILPVVTASIPATFANQALNTMAVTFRVNGILTDQKPQVSGDPPILLMPTPKERTGTWSWLENDDTGWNTYQIEPNDPAARLTQVAPVLRRGLLQLSSGAEQGAKQRGAKKQV